MHNQTRRRCLQTLLAWALLPASLWQAGRAQAGQWLADAFTAKNTSDVLTALQVGATPVQPEVQIDAPQKAENGAVVQVEVMVTTPVGSVRSLRLLADANPTPLVASFVLGQQVLPRLVTRIKMAQSGDLIALVESATGSYSQQRKAVIVLEDGCASNEREEPFASSMKLRARLLENGSTELKIIILHPMRTGRGKGDDGQLLPAHFMQQMQVLLNGQLLVDAQTGTAISRNPYFTFYLSAANAGDVVTVQWQDNRGLHGEGQTTVSAG